MVCFSLNIDKQINVCYYIKPRKKGKNMAYYFMVEKRDRTNKRNYVAIDVSKSPCFSRLSNLKENRFKLQELDYFTMMFNNEEELRRHLFKEGLINMEDSRRPLSIRNKINGEYEKVRYDFLYQKDLEYIVDPNKLIKRIEDKLYEEDFTFLADLANNYVNHRYCGWTAFDVRLHASDSIRNNYSKCYLYREDENRDNLIKRMIKLIIYKSYRGRKGFIFYKTDESGKPIVNYLELHKLLAFINNYERKERQKISEDENSKTNNFEGLEYEQTIFDIASNEEQKSEYTEDIITSKNEVKKRILSKDSQIDGQYSLF